ncbi:MAG: translation elongation factor Ts, partial [Acidimicrobiales bacterium]|nr:translation elongation factor Ts [Acidimicrobiales bacterium]
ALTETNGDMEAAKLWLREKGLSSSSSRSSRENTQGAIALSSHGEATSMVELKCETDFVAKSEQFVNFVQDLADLVAAKGPDSVSELTNQVDQLKITLKENIELGQAIQLVAGASSNVGTYLHVQAGRGVNGVLVELDGGSAEIAHDIAVHIAFTKPQYLNRDEVPADEVDKERSTIENISRNEGKPEAALSKIVEGRLTGWFKDRCLLEQDYVRDEKQSVVSHLQGAKVIRYYQVVIGG